MKRGTGSLPFRVSCFAFLVFVAACSPKPPAAVPAELRRVTLPDLTHTAPSVRDQLREGHAALNRTIEAKDVSQVDLGDAYGRMGMLLMAAEFRNDAEGAFLNAQALSPGQARWPYYLGHLYRINGDAGKSAAAFEKARALQPDDVPTLVWLGNALLDSGQPEAAEPFFTKALSIQPRLVIAELGVGRAALARQQYGRAVEALERALSHDPKATVVHYPLALAYRGLGDAAKASAHMQQRGTLEIKPDDPLMHELDSLLHSALAYEVAGADALDRADWDAAAESFRKGLALAPEEPSLHHKLGTALALKGDQPGAVAEFEQALRVSPGFAKAHYSLGVILVSNGQPQQAAAHFAAAIKTEPGYLEPRLQLANILRRGGEFQASLPHYDYIVKADPRMLDARFGYAASLVRLRRFGEARDRFEAAMNDYPGEFAFAHATARLLAAAPDDRVRDGRRALSIIQNLLDKGFRTFESLETMAMAQAEVGQFSGAATWQRDAIAAAGQTAGPSVAQRIGDNLRLYEAGRPCRTPWRPDEPMEFQSTGTGAALDAGRGGAVR